MVEMKWWNLFLILSTMPGKKKLWRIWPLKLLPIRAVLHTIFCALSWHWGSEYISRKGWKSMKNSDIFDMLFVKKKLHSSAAVIVKSTLASILNRFCSSSGVSNRWTWTILLCYYDEVKYSQNFREWKVFSKRNSHAVINSHLIRTRQSRGKGGGVLIPLTLSLCLHLKILIFAFLKLF